MFFCKQVIVSAVLAIASLWKTVCFALARCLKWDSLDNWYLESFPGSLAGDRYQQISSWNRWGRPSLLEKAMAETWEPPGHPSALLSAPLSCEKGSGLPKRRSAPHPGARGDAAAKRPPALPVKTGEADGGDPGPRQGHRVECGLRFLHHHPCGCCHGQRRCGGPYIRRRPTSAVDEGEGGITDEEKGPKRWLWTKKWKDRYESEGGWWILRSISLDDGMVKENWEWLDAVESGSF